MRSSACLLLSSFVLGCSGAPHAPPAPIEDPPSPVASATVAPVVDPGQVAVLEPTARQVTPIDDGPLRAEVVPGMERLERIGRLEGGTRCGTRIGKSPVCIGDFRAGPTSLEALQPVKRLEAQGGAHCVLFESGKLGCDIVSRATGAKSSVASTNVDDFVIGPADEIYALSHGGNVVVNVPREDGTLRTKIVLRGASDIASALSGVCARTLKGGIECTDVDEPTEQRTHSVNGMDEVLSIELGGVIRKKDKTLWILGEDKADPFRATRIERPEGGSVTAKDFAWDPEPCVVTVEGGVACVDFTRTPSVTKFASRRVELPRTAVRIRPRGAPCAELDDGTVACWGSQLDELRRLGLRVLAMSPGSIAPHL